jgi:excisionase family DNA binding protein
MPSKIHLRKEIGAMDMKYQSLESLPLALSVDDLMDILNVGKNTAYSLVKSGQLRSIRIGRQLRIPRDALREFLQGKTA